jgi:hypothetical protein
MNRLKTLSNYTGKIVSLHLAPMCTVQKVYPTNASFKNQLCLPAIPQTLSINIAITRAQCRTARTKVTAVPIMNGVDDLLDRIAPKNYMPEIFQYSPTDIV